MFTDMVGYTALAQDNEAMAMGLLDEQRRVVRSFFPRYNGKEVKTIGDAFLVQFKSALEAVECASDIQRHLHELNNARPSERKIVLRIGIHVGDVIDEGTDIQGDAVNIASRIEPLATPGGVCISEQAFDQTRNKMSLPVVRLEKQTLKNVSGPMDVYRVVMSWDPKLQPESESLDRRRIAVLPFYNMSSSVEDEYFADGMTEELITTLSKVGALSVISRTSIMPYRKAPKALKEIGRELQAGTIIEGSVRKSGQTFRITVQMIDAQNDKHIWADSYDRNLQDIFATQSEIASKVVESLEIRLVDSERALIDKPPTLNVDVYTLCLKARSLWNMRTKEANGQAIALFEAALKLEPNSARANAGLADCYSIAATYRFMERLEAERKAKESVLRALELDDNLPEAHAALGLMFLDEMKYESSEKEFNKAISSSPSYASAHQWYGLLLEEVGRLSEGMAELAKAIQLDPLSPPIRTAYAISFHLAERDDEYMAALTELIQAHPDLPNAYSYRSWLNAFRGQRDEALRDLETYRRLSKNEMGYEAEMAITEVLWGNKTKGYEHMEKAMSLMEKSPPEFALTPYWFYAAVGDKDQFFAWVERAIGQHLTTAADLRYDPCLREMRDDPRYKELYKRFNLSE